jgi:hypothetical protein
MLTGVRQLNGSTVLVPGPLATAVGSSKLLDQLRSDDELPSATSKTSEIARTRLLGHVVAVFRDIGSL